MQLLLTHGSTARTRLLQFQPWQVVLVALSLLALLMALSGASTTLSSSRPLARAGLW